MRQAGIAAAVVDRAGRGEPVLGLCGGCEMLGREIHDPDGVESPQSYVAGLGLLPLVTRFERTKITAQVVARSATPSFLTSGLPPDAEVRGYEIHMGRVERPSDAAATFHLIQRNGEPTELTDGAVSPDGAVVGTLLHGVLENVSVRASLLATLRRRRGLPAPSDLRPIPSKDGEYDRLAAMLRENLDLGALRRVLGLSF
jgi:adenosylcobyric acid synthase